MSPSYYNGHAGVFNVASNSVLSDWYVGGSGGVRPVINLKADTIFAEGGDGTSSNPYVVM